MQVPRIVPLAGAAGNASVLRLDEVHPVVSGNKWYKLAGYLEQAKTTGKSKLITFGGAYSNHIVATAAACAAVGIEAIGLIRGEAPETLSPTLLDARNYGMQLHFLSRTAYREKQIPDDLKNCLEQSIVVGEGGYGQLGTSGICAMAAALELHEFTHMMCAVGTGTTLAGLIQAAAPQQQLLGISALKHNYELENAVKVLTGREGIAPFQILHDFHFGGYAKHTSELLAFMNEWYQQTGIPSDFVYTGKLFYAYSQLQKQGYFGNTARVLLVHSGGLQGNRSLPAGTLVF